MLILITSTFFKTKQELIINFDLEITILYVDWRYCIAKISNHSSLQYYYIHIELIVVNLSIMSKQLICSHLVYFKY